VDLSYSREQARETARLMSAHGRSHDLHARRRTRERIITVRAALRISAKENPRHREGV
jgi:hypothetical protein